MTATFQLGAAQAGVIVAALLSAAAVLARGRRARTASMAGAFVLTPVLLIAHVWEAPQFAPFREQPLLAAGAAAVALAFVGVGAALLRRWPSAFALAALAALPFRLPIESGGTSANLLVPLYLVVGAGVAARVLAALRADGDDAAEPAPTPRPGAVEWLVMAMVVLYAAQSLYSEGFDKALEQVVFFYVPFALLFALLVEVEWTPRLLRACLGVLVGLALAFCAVGFVEYQQRALLLNPEVIASNQFQSYFRVSSLFFDPNIFGRFLVMVMLAVTATMLWARRARDVWLFALVLAVLWGGLVLTLSQSSLAALLAGLTVLAALRWSAGWTAAVALAAAAVAAAGVVAFPEALRLKLNDQESLQAVTSGRAKLIAGGARLFAQRPMAGWGSGSFERVYRREEDVSGERAITASHTIGLTIAAEQGAIGALAYLGLLAAAFWRLLRGARGSTARGAAIAAAFAALVVHTLLYAAFLEDPLTWALLAIGSALAWQGRPPDPDRHPAESLRE